MSLGADIRDCHLKKGAWLRIHQLQLTAKFLYALTHSADSYSYAAGFECRYIVGNSFTVIAHSDRNESLTAFECDASIPSARVAEDVGERLLNDAIDGIFNRWGQSRKLRWF